MAPTEGETVQVHYRGTLDNGEEFDSSQGREPIEFTVGEGQVIPGFEEAVKDMQPGEKKNVRIPAAEAYGERIDEALQKVPRDAFAEEPVVGAVVGLQAQDGSQLAATITEIGPDEVTLDFNHPLAGEALNFELELVGTK